MFSYNGMKAITMGIEVGSIVLLAQILNVSLNDKPLDKLTVSLGIGLYVGAKVYEHVYVKNVLNRSDMTEGGLEKKVDPSQV